MQKIIASLGSFQFLLLFLVLFCVSSYVMFSVVTFISLDDPFFHIRFAQEFRNEGLSAFREFDAIYFSDIAQNQKYFVYYNFLFYIALIPFTYIEPLSSGIKLFSAFSFAFIFSLLAYIFNRFGIRYACAWSFILFIFVGAFDIWRFFAARPYTLAPVLLVLLVYLSYKRNYIGIALLTFLYFYWHTATFFFPLILVTIYTFIRYIRVSKFDFRPLLYVFSATSVAFAFSLFFAPGLFLYLKDIIFGVIFSIVSGNSTTVIQQGSELKGVNIFDMFHTNEILLSLFILGGVHECIRLRRFLRGGHDETREYRDLATVRLTLFVFGLLLILGTSAVGRNKDFFIIVCVAFIALSLNELFKQISIKDILWQKSLSIGVVIFLVYATLAQIFVLQESISNTGSHFHLQGSSRWIKNNVSEGEVIFHTTWNSFPLLYYYNPGYKYISGLEPRFLYDFDPELYWKWESISLRGYVCDRQECDELSSDAKKYIELDTPEALQWKKSQAEKIASSLQDDFKSRYVLLQHQTYSQLEGVLKDSEYFTEVYQDSIFGFKIYETVEDEE